MVELLLAGVAWAAPLTGDRGLVALDPTPPPGLGLSAADCVQCHETVVQQWQGSRHAVAGTNPTFWQSWTRYPLGWCVQCHAPLAEAQRATLGGVARPGAFLRPAEPRGLWTEGVTCAACHLRDGVVLSSRAPTAAAEAAHPVRHEPRLGTADACAGCHEFPFQHPVQPGQTFALGTTPAQETVTEWAGSTRAETPCQGCHMQAGHDFPGGRSPDLVRDLLQVEVVRTESTAAVTVRAPGAAHRVPTGDPFRRLQVDLCAEPACEAPVSTTTLRRVFQAGPDGWTLVVDRTVPPETERAPAARTVLLDARGAAWWRLSYRAADPAHEPDLPPDEVGFVVHEGPLPPPLPGGVVLSCETPGLYCAAPLASE